MKKLRELFRLKYDSELTHRQIGRALNISPGTVSYYTQAFIKKDLQWPLSAELDDAALMEILEPLAKQLAKTSGKYVKPNWESVHKELHKKHMTLMLLWEDYVKEHRERAYSYSQYTRHYKAWCKKKKVSMRLEHTPGKEAFIDYAGTGLPIYCRQSGKELFKAQLFIMALGFSQYTFAYATRSQKLPDWIDAHVRAFRFFAGVPVMLVPDNLKSGITDSCQFEPEANPTYADMAEHYATAIIPARPRKPQDKSIAENSVLLASRWILARLLRQKFYSLNALNNAIAELLKALNTKAFQKRQGSRYQQFMEVEKKALRPLPVAEYEFATLKYQALAADYHVYVDGHYYSAPYKFIHEKVLCRYTQTTVEIFHNHKRIASHLRSFEKDKKTTVGSHMPKVHQAYLDWSPQSFLDWAKQIGPGIYHVAEQFIKEKTHPELCSKLHMGLKKLAKRFGGNRLNKACRRAVALKCIQYKSIQSILEKGLDKQSHVQSVESSELKTPLHSNVRGSAYYQKLL